MRALDRLRQARDLENSQHVPPVPTAKTDESAFVSFGSAIPASVSNCAGEASASEFAPTPLRHELTKPPEGAFVSFGSAPGDSVSKFTVGAVALAVTEGEPVNLDDGSHVVRTPTRASAEREPLATPEQEAELRDLVARVSADWPAGEPEAALAAALADPVAALECYRYLAQTLPAEPRAAYGVTTTLTIAERDPDDDRRLCTECANLTPGRRCLAARRGEGPALYGAPRDYVPVLGTLGRCIGYAPRADDPDRRPGAERWPSLVEDAKRRSEAL